MRKFIVFLCCVVWMGVLVLPVSADSPDNGTVNSTALTYFTGVVNKLPENCDYVIYRSGDNTTNLVFGSNFKLNNNTITSSKCTQMIYNQRGMGSGTQYVPTISKSELNSFNLSTSDSSIIYSSLGSWSSVGDTNRDNISYILWSVVLLVLLFIVFKFHRNRRHYINL